MKAIVLATIAAIAVQPVVAFCWLLPSRLASGNATNLAEILEVAALVATVAAPVVLAVGVPSLMILRRVNRLSGLSLGCVGAIAGSIVLLLVMDLTVGSFIATIQYGTSRGVTISQDSALMDWLRDALFVIPYGVAHGGTAGLVGSWVWRRTTRSSEVR
jgi:hypothetical protein